MERNKKVFIVGHKNPDTDSICAAIAYADLKNKTEGSECVFIPKRAGELNEETKFVLHYFGIEKPDLLEDVKTQIQDIDIEEVKGVSKELSLKKAWELMKKEKVESLPVVNEENRLEGVITVGDIAKSYMDTAKDDSMGPVRTKYKNILETIDGRMVFGNAHSQFHNGKVLVVAEETLPLNQIQVEDLIITEGGSPLQRKILELGVAGLIVCQQDEIEEEMIELAREKECQLVVTKRDIYTVSRLLCQSMPIRQFMSKRDLDTFWLEDTVESIRDTVAKKRRRDFPVLDGEGRYCGMLSRRNLINHHRKHIILVDHNESTQAVEGVEDAHIMEVVDHHRLGNLETISPLYFRNQPVGSTSTIIYDIYKEHNLVPEKEIAGIMCAAILSDTLMFRSPTCTQKDKNTAEVLAKLAGIQPQEFANAMFLAGSNLAEKDAKEIFYQDFKTFMVNGIHFGVGQISSMNGQELEQIKEMLLPQMQQEFYEKKLHMLYFMLTNIMTETTELLCLGEKIQSVVRDSFGVELQNGCCILKGIVSRKKQLIPALLVTLQD